MNITSTTDRKVPTKWREYLHVVKLTAPTTYSGVKFTQSMPAGATRKSGVAGST